MKVTVFSMAALGGNTLEREVDAEIVNEHYLFKQNVLLVPGGRKSYWFIAKITDSIIYHFFRTKRQALKFLKEVSP